MTRRLSIVRSHHANVTRKKAGLYTITVCILFIIYDGSWSCCALGSDEASTVPGDDAEAARMARQKYQESQLQTPPCRARRTTTAKSDSASSRPKLSRNIQSVRIFKRLRQMRTEDTDLTNNSSSKRQTKPTAAKARAAKKPDPPPNKTNMKQEKTEANEKSTMKRTKSEVSAEVTTPATAKAVRESLNRANTVVAPDGDGEDPSTEEGRADAKHTGKRKQQKKPADKTNHHGNKAKSKATPAPATKQVTATQSSSTGDGASATKGPTEPKAKSKPTSSKKDKEPCKTDDKADKTNKAGKKAEKAEKAKKAEKEIEPSKEITKDKDDKKTSSEPTDDGDHSSSSEDACEKAEQVLRKKAAHARFMRFSRSLKRSLPVMNIFQSYRSIDPWHRLNLFDKESPRPLKFGVPELPRSDACGLHICSRLV